MSAKAIREFDGKHLLSYWLHESDPSLNPSQMVSLEFNIQLLSNPNEFHLHVKDTLLKAEKENPWLLSTSLVCKPDQLIKRRGKNGLLGINLNWSSVKQWITQRAGTTFKVILHLF